MSISVHKGDNERGFAQVLMVVLLLAGLAVGVYLVQQQTNFLPKAQLVSGPITPTLTPISNPIGGSAKIVSQVSYSYDDVNEVNGAFDAAYRPSSSKVWIGNAGSGQDSWTGLRFTNVNVPQRAVIKSAKLEVYSSTSQWVAMKVNLAAEATGSAKTFSSSSLPSGRVLTAQKILKSTNNQWNSGQWYEVADLINVVQEVVSRSDWQSGNSLSIIIHGVGPAWGRKFVSSYDGASTLAPKLTVTY